MSQTSRIRPGLALLATALGTGVAVGAFSAGFIWLIGWLTDLVWVALPDRLGVDGFDWWWVVAAPVAGGLLAGLGQRFLGFHPAPLHEAVSAWRSGGGIDAATTGPSLVNALPSLVFGGPLGFEAALVGVVGGFGAWAGDRIGRVGEMTKACLGLSPDEALPRAWKSSPAWLAAIVGVLTFRALPFGSLHFGVDLPELSSGFDLGAGLLALGLGSVFVLPATLTLVGVHRLEELRPFRRAPELFGMAAGLALGLAALGSDLVLFSGQHGIAEIAGADNGELIYAAVAKLVLLLVVIAAGWRGGPVFPIWFSIAALTTIAGSWADVDVAVPLAAGLAAVSVAFLGGKAVGGVLLTMLVAPFSLFGPILVGAVGAAAGFALFGSLGWLGSASEDRQAGTRETEHEDADGTGEGAPRQEPEHQ